MALWLGLCLHCNADYLRGVAFHRSLLYELHVGTFTEEGTFDALIGKLDYLSDLG